MKKYNVLYIGAPTKNISEKWGGAYATAYAFEKSFIDNLKYNIIFIDKHKILTLEDFENVIIQNEHDILHIDDSRIIELMYDNNIPPPDIIGPITRSPIKEYKDWKPHYDENYFYSAKVIRLNRSEEYVKVGPDLERVDYTDKVIFINHGIDTNLLTPSKENKNIIIWAGDAKRAAKGFQMWEKIKSTTVLPKNYRFMTLSNYTIENYWIILDYVKIIVNTSLNETFCCAMFEAKSKAIPSIYKKDLHNGRHLDGRIQVEYDVDAYKEEIMKLLNDDEYYNNEAILSRKYTVDNFSLNKMAETYSSVYDLILNNKNIK